MEKDYIFLGTTGLTDTTASRYADFAKLSYTEAESSLSSLKFINTKIECIDGTNAKDLSYGIKSLESIPNKIEEIGDLKALCAWLREAVLAHQRVIDSTKKLTIDDYAKLKNIKLPQVPESVKKLTEDDILATFDIKKRNRYYSLEAHAATIGQFIHKGGCIDSARKELYDKINNPRQTEGTGHDMLIRSFEASVDTSDVERIFYELQQKHASYQSELNSIKSEIKSRIDNDLIDKSKTYEVAYTEYSESYKKIFNEFKVWQQEEQKRVNNLKIVIPNSLKSIFEKVSQLGK